MKRWRLAALLLVAAALVPVSGQEVATTITHGPILGRLTSTDVGVWARTAQPGTFRVRYGTAPAQLDAWSDRATTRIEHDNTGWVRITGLTPDTTYHYQVVVDGADMPIRPHGSFTTLPSADGVRNAAHNPKGLFNFRFEFGTGNNQRPSGSGSWPPAFRTMLDRLKGRVHFHIQNGDFIYEDGRALRVADWLKQVGLTAAQAPPLVNLAPAIVGVWQNYKIFLERGDALAEWHRYVPSFFTFDDHEILDNIDGGATIGRRDRRAVFRDVGTQAWYDYVGWANPAPDGRIRFGQAQLKAGSDILTDPAADFSTLGPEAKEPGALHVHWGGRAAGVPPRELAELTQADGVDGDPNANVYEIVEVLDAHRLRVRPAAKADGLASYSIGRHSYFDMRVSNTHFFVLDTRSYRGVSDPTSMNRPDLSMLGAAQKAWLKEGMQKSDADVFFVVSQVTMMIPHVGGTPSAGATPRDPAAAPTRDEAWTGYLNERDELIRFWDGLGKPVLVLTGDIHNSFSIKVTDRVWEFASGPHNSRNHRMDAEGNRPANGTYDSSGRTCEIRWSTGFLPDVPAELVRQPVFTTVQINNVFNNRLKPGETRWVAFPRPQVVVQFHDGFTGEVMYAESVLAGR